MDDGCFGFLNGLLGVELQARFGAADIKHSTGCLNHGLNGIRIAVARQACSFPLFHNGP